MIASLRRWHRRTFLGLAVALPMAVALGISNRTRTPWEQPGPTRRRFEPGLWPGWQIGTSLESPAEGGVQLALEFDDLGRPDVLLYFSAGDRQPGETLPADAWLIGVVARGAGLSVPPELSGRRGRLILYSLGDGVVVAVSAVVSLPRHGGGPR